MSIRLGLIAALVLLAWPHAAPAQTGDPVIDAIFDEIEQRLIQEYYGNLRAAGLDADDDQGQGLGQGKGKAKGKGLKRGWVQGIPPGHLPLPLPGTERLLVDDDIFLVRLGTRVILDVIEGVLLEQ